VVLALVLVTLVQLVVLLLAAAEEARLQRCQPRWLGPWLAQAQLPLPSRRDSQEPVQLVRIP
jgi:hypothetical protein